MQALIRASFLAATLLAAGQATAATCGDPAGFEKWLDDIGQEATSRASRRRRCERPSIRRDLRPRVIRKDRGQGFSTRASSNSRPNWFTA